jgi:hypothetical protein
VHVISAPDRLRGNADHLPVAVDWLTCVHVTQGHFVPGRDGLARLKGVLALGNVQGEGVALRQVDFGDGYVVSTMQDEHILRKGSNTFHKHGIF